MNILIIELSKMGDIIQSFPLMRHLYASNPESSITYLHNEMFSEVLTLYPEIIPFPVNLDHIINGSSDQLLLNSSNETQDLIQTLSNKHFDLAINLNISPMAKQILDLVKAKQKRGFGSSNHTDEELEHLILSFQKTRQLDTLNLVDIFLNFSPYTKISKAIAPKSDKRIKTKSKSYNVTMQLGSRNAKRHPSIADFAILANLLIKNGYTVSLTGSNAETPLFEHFIQKIHQKNAIVYRIGKTNLKELKNLISDSDFLITPDTGTMHIASLTDTPIFAFFAGSAYPYETIAYREHIYTSFHLPDQLPCYPCPENTPCPNHFICHRFDMDAIAQLITENTKTAKIYETTFDAIGQYLFPLIKTEISYIQLKAYLWRIFIAQYFFQQKLTLKDIKSHLMINEENKNQFITQIKREILLFERLSGITSIEEIIQNFDFLAPYLIFLLIHKNESQLKMDFIDFIEKIQDIFE